MLGAKLNELRLEGLYCDFQFCTDDQTILPLHKIVIAAKSEMLKRKLNANGENYIKVVGISKNVLEAFINYLYLDSIDIEGNHLKDFVKLCYDFKVDIKLMPNNNSQVSLVNSMTKHKASDYDTSYNYKTFRCHSCGKIFHERKFWLEHIKTHSRTQHHNIKVNRENNNKKIEADAKLYSCELCKKVFTTKGNLVRHIKVVHNGIKIHKCDFCDKVFGQKVSLQWHCLSVHKNEIEFKDGIKGISSTKCDILSKSSGACISKIRKELSRNTTKEGSCIVKFHEDNYNCNQRNQSDLSNQLTKIGLVELNSKRTCHICNKLLSNPTNLKAHLLIHKSHKLSKQREKPIANFGETRSKDDKNNTNQSTSNLPICHLCGKQFTIPRYLTRHIQAVHSEFKSHKCQHCKKLFSTRPELIKHQTVHKEFKCDKCQEIFIGKRAYSFHVRSSCGSSLFLINGELNFQTGDHGGLLNMHDTFS